MSQYPGKPRSNSDDVDEQEYLQNLLGDKEVRSAEMAAMDYEDVNHCPHGVPYTETCDVCLESVAHDIDAA